ncbi:E3 ubiquitin-protein ligase RNF180 isoform X1 [Monodelphis domestica]|uniref:E3 ubiquitin-protein ligase RNF180 n=2 Tax=Monodelphis domestica TaxID=13616 RepID=F6XQ71_MONDO|nr:E3 ubiquitin-protein ligase RNF180 isoform X1 [Monodelphis domestica]XP_016286796.1 E3 ubiquitin-protein ligase RNF180 isoform X1 [Monodelphis domestica]XP_056680846.1 E3 ubiquitin-protein ligase RNF180 isoform X1 [Monodelphis domestica]
MKRLEMGMKMHNQEEIAVLRCWKCRKCVANSNCFTNCIGKQLSENGHELAATPQNICNVWHMNIEALPEWMNYALEKAQWTIGKLNCPFCRTRLGGFNFIRSPKCSCGQFVAVRLCKSRTDYQPVHLIRLTRPSVKYLSFYRIPSGPDKENTVKNTGVARENRNQGLLNMAQNNNVPGRLTEALCLEVRSTNFETKSKKLHLKASNPKYCLFVPQSVNERCSIRAFHRKSHSLDLNIREKLALLPTLYEAHGKIPACNRLNETQPFDPHGLYVGSSKNRCSPPESSGFDGNGLLQRFSVPSCNTLRQREEEFQCGLEASIIHSHHNTIDELPFRMDFPVAVSGVDEPGDQEEGISSIGFLQSAGFSLGAINQRLSKRERNKLKNLRRKQRRHQRWLQKQTLNNDVSTDDDNECTEEKESYICAVCLDVYFNPYMCYPCHHIFCEPCLRTLAKDNPTSTPCPLCRTIISRVFFQTDLNNATKTFFTKEYLKIKQSFQKSNSAKWPLPSCRKAFHLFGGFRRRADPVTRRQFPHGAHRMDYMHFEDDSRAWWFDMDMVIIYIYSVNWVIGFIVFCFLCYFFFPF